MVLASMLKKCDAKIRQLADGTVVVVVSSGFSSTLDPTINLETLFGRARQRDVDMLRDAFKDLTTADPILPDTSFINDFFKVQALMQEDPDEPRKSLRGKKHHGFAIPPKHQGGGGRMTSRTPRRRGRRSR